MAHLGCGCPFNVCAPGPGPPWPIDGRRKRELRPEYAISSTTRMVVINLAKSKLSATTTDKLSPKQTPSRRRGHGHWGDHGHRPPPGKTRRCTFLEPFRAHETTIFHSSSSCRWPIRSRREWLAMQGSGRQNGISCSSFGSLRGGHKFGAFPGPSIYPSVLLDRPTQAF